MRRACNKEGFRLARANGTVAAANCAGARLGNLLILERLLVLFTQANWGALAGVVVCYVETGRDMTRTVSTYSYVRHLRVRK